MAPSRRLFHPTHDIHRALAFRRLALLVVAIVGFAAPAAGCSGGRPNDQSYNYFLTAVASADKDGYVPYWLGREFTVDGVTFRGPSLAGFNYERKGGGIGMTYSAGLKGKGRGSGLAIGLFSAEAWRLAQANASHSAESSRPVTINGHPGWLRTLSEGGQIGQLSLEVDLGDTKIIAKTNQPERSASGEDTSNPLIDEAQFLAVMERLRPFPQ